MSGLEYVLRSGKSVREICEAAAVTEESQALAGSQAKPVDFVGALADADQFVEAIGFLAHALPKREAVWWAWTCARDTAGTEPKEVIQAALDATGSWITDPTDDNRRAAYQAAQDADIGTPAGCAGAAAFFCGDTMGPPDQPPMPPGEYMAAKAIAGCILLSAATKPEEIGDLFRDFMSRGLDVAERVQLWHPPEG
ncbi:MAG: DUF6931 family protein [Longimicrobiales bacterium]